MEIERDDTAIKAEKIYEDIVYYFLNKDINELLFPTIYATYLEKEFVEFERKATDASNAFASSTSKLIQEIASKLGLEKNLLVSPVKGKGQRPNY